ncbi:hypothetical protein TNCV_3770831 [Trichonephila clavipes]|nr:hypothetical protein TNCV_3770831 [Trichonephila clavipes]
MVSRVPVQMSISSCYRDSKLQGAFTSAEIANGLVILNHGVMRTTLQLAPHPFRTSTPFQRRDSTYLTHINLSTRRVFSSTRVRAASMFNRNTVG